jgi:hypothetical protein
MGWAVKGLNASGEKKFFSYPKRPDRPCGVMLATYLNLVPTLRMSGATPPLVVVLTEKTLTFFGGAFLWKC